MTDSLHSAATANVGPLPLRFSADMECRNYPAADKITANCSAVATSADRLYTMYTYNSADYYEWVHQQLSPALATVPLETLGVGLGCWTSAELNHTWSLSPEAAADRVCKLMNESVQEIGMFLLSQGSGQHEPSSPEPFWISPLERFMTGASCAAKVPTADDVMMVCVQNCNNPTAAPTAAPTTPSALKELKLTINVAYTTLNATEIYKLETAF